MESQAQQIRHAWLRRTTTAVLICAGLICLFFLLGWSAIQTKSPTMDEPINSVSAYVHVFEHDYRMVPEHPPLWNYLAMLPHSRGDLHLDFSQPSWQYMIQDSGFGGDFATRTLFHTPGNDGVAFINASRNAMLLVGIALGAMLAWWSWKLAGATGAIVAVTLYCFDPNFLAHAPLLLNDVAISLLMLALGASLWIVGRRAAWWSLPLPGIVLGLAISVKLSGILFVPMLLLTLAVRALLPAPWPVLRTGVVRGIVGRLLLAGSIAVMSLGIGWLILWATYGFRFDPTGSPGVLLPTQRQVHIAAQNELIVRTGHQPTTAQVEASAPSLLARAVLFAQDHRLFPQSWLFGILFVYQASLVRTCYLLGQHGITGWWYYFPLAMLFKTPVATLLAFALGLCFAVARMKHWRRPSAGAGKICLDAWSAACLLIPLLIYAANSLTTHLNLGLRHVLPLYPFAYILVGIAAAQAAQTHPRATARIATVLAIALAVETLCAFPDYIAFFNAPSRPWQLYLLSDSNLDWGQDLPALAQWHRRHPGQRLYLAYFGTVNPAAYGIVDYVNMPGGYWLGPPAKWPDPRYPGVIAISANRLQGNNMPPDLIDAYDRLRTQTPREILGQSIYLFDYPPTRP